MCKTLTAVKTIVCIVELQQLTSISLVKIFYIRWKMFLSLYTILTGLIKQAVPKDRYDDIYLANLVIDK